MGMAHALLAEFEQEVGTTRRFLERLPADKLTWKPHEKSMSAGQLALHIAATPGQVAELAKGDEVPAPDFNRPNPQPQNLREIMETLERSVATVKQVLPSLDDGRMQGMWKATKNGKEVVAMPRAAFLRSILLNHWYHHRGQFGVYLRLVGAQVPSSYGPSGDELPEFMKGK